MDHLYAFKLCHQLLDSAREPRTSAIAAAWRGCICGTVGARPELLCRSMGMATLTCFFSKLKPRILSEILSFDKGSKQKLLQKSLKQVPPDGATAGPWDSPRSLWSLPVP